MKKQTIRIIIADDHPLFREGLNNIVALYRHIHIVAEASTGQQAIELCRHHNPDVILMDIHMPGMDGIKATSIIHVEMPSIEVLALSMLNDENYIFSMLDAGAIGYLTKSAGKKEVSEAIEMAAQHKPYFCKDTPKEVLHKIAGRQHPSADTKPLFTPTELEIIDLICQEKTSHEISEALGYESTSIEKYRYFIIQKMGVRNMVGIVKYAIRKNMFHLR
jgi:DNA-binding NarL/FixJ family response regulator